MKVHARVELSLLIAYLSSGCKSVVSLTPQPFYPYSKHSHHESTRMLGGPEKVWIFWTCEKSLALTRNWTVIPLLSSTIASSLNQLHYLRSSVLSVKSCWKYDGKFSFTNSVHQTLRVNTMEFEGKTVMLCPYTCLWLVSSLEVGLLGKHIPGSGAALQEATSTTPVIWRSCM
jgi:hypothetical protein